MLSAQDALRLLLEKKIVLKEKVVLEEKVVRLSPGRRVLL